MSHQELMDRIYRYQRGIYDITRKYFLLGRDCLLDEMTVRNGDWVLEVGCGTARNLLLLADKHPRARYFGLDISHEMLRTAEAKLAKRPGLDMTLVQCAAEELDHAKTFGVNRPFDAIFFSYALSMIPPWREALDAAARNLAPGGSIYIVDFWDQRDLPGWFRAILQRWLALFHVHHEPALISHLESLHAQGSGKLELKPLYGRYTLLATFTPTPASVAETASS